MVSEVNNAPPSHITGIDQKLTQINPSEKAAPTNAPQSGGETVTLTDLANRVEELTKSVENLPISDAEKVARLRDEIASGTYQVDAEAVAEKFNAIEQILNAGASRSSQQS